MNSPLPPDLPGELIVPVRSSGGRLLTGENVPLDEMRHGSDDRGRFLGAYTERILFAEHGPPGSDWILVPAEELVARATDAGERIVLDPGAPGQRELGEPLGAAAGESAGAMPSARRAAPRPSVIVREPLADLRAPGDVPRPLADALRRSLDELPQVERAWLLQRNAGWTIGILQRRDATLSDFDEVRNRLHAVATEQLGTRRLLAVTDLRAPSVRQQYESLAPPFYERRGARGFLSRIFGR